MVKSNTARTVIHDPSSAHLSKLGGSHKEWDCFMSSNVGSMYGNVATEESMKNPELDEKMDMKKLLKDIERLGSSTLDWKERKKLENKNVVSLGGKPIKGHRTPLSVTIPMMKNIKKRELKKIEEEKLLGIFTKRKNNNRAEHRRPENRVLKSTEGYFNKGVLNVKHLLDHKPMKSEEESSKMIGKRRKGKGKGKGKGKNKGKGKGKRR